MFFSVITRNLNWKILTKNLATFKDGMGLMMKNFNIMRVHWKILFSGGSQKNQYIGGNCLEKGGLVKKRGMHNMVHNVHNAYYGVIRQDQADY